MSESPNPTFDIDSELLAVSGIRKLVEFVQQANASIAEWQTERERNTEALNDAYCERDAVKKDNERLRRLVSQAEFDEERRCQWCRRPKGVSHSEHCPAFNTDGGVR